MKDFPENVWVIKLPKERQLEEDAVDKYGAKMIDREPYLTVGTLEGHIIRWCEFLEGSGWETMYVSVEEALVIAKVKGLKGIALVDSLRTPLIRDL